MGMGGGEETEVGLGGRKDVKVEGWEERRERGADYSDDRVGHEYRRIERSEGNSCWVSARGIFDEARVRGSRALAWCTSDPNPRLCSPLATSSKNARDCDQHSPAEKIPARFNRRASSA